MIRLALGLCCGDSLVVHHAALNSSCKVLRNSSAVSDAHSEGKATFFHFGGLLAGITDEGLAVSWQAYLYCVNLNNTKDLLSLAKQTA
ncbi:MAG: hypothetical protein WCK96_12515 [Methylococcales bacterium]